MLFIKIKVKGYLKNLTENEVDIIESKAIKTSNKIVYISKDIKHILFIEDNKIILCRENNEFSHKIIFKENITNSSEYYLKESNYSIEFNILTTKLTIDKNKIDIMYKILESENIYNYVLEMSDIS